MRDIQAGASEMKNRAGDAATRLNSQRDRIADRIGDAAGTLRQRAEQGTRMQHEAQRRLAHGMENAADYIHHHEPRDVARDFSGLVRRNPVVSVLIAVALLFLLVRMLR
jgi:hypothetical protein